MSDRSSAELFADIFEMLAEDPTDANKARARQFWEKARGYDFSYCQMGCDDALVTLGLARRGVDMDYPDDGETVLYGPEGTS